MNEAELKIIKHGMKRYWRYRHIAIYKEHDGKNYFVCLRGYDDKEECSTIYGVEQVPMYKLLNVIHDMEAFL